MIAKNPDSKPLPNRAWPQFLTRSGARPVSRSPSLDSLPTAMAAPPQRKHKSPRLGGQAYSGAKVRRRGLGEQVLNFRMLLHIMLDERAGRDRLEALRSNVVERCLDQPRADPPPLQFV